MDCRETQALLTAFHDGELPDTDRARVTDHLRGCPECGERLAGLARVDAAANVPDPGQGYWDRFNARVLERVEREAEGPKAAVLRPKRGWMRQQLRYLVPAAAVAAMVMAVVRYGGLHPGAPTMARDGQVPGQAGMPRGLSPRPQAVPQAVRGPAAPDAAGQRAAKAEREPPATIKRESSASARRAPEESPRGAEADGMSTRMQGERKRVGETAAPAAEPQVDTKAESASGMRIAEDRSAEPPATASLGKSRPKAGPSPLASASPRAASSCDLARTRAAQGRWREAETAQRDCLSQDRSAPAQEKGLVFLAELLDRQERFAEADVVIKEVDRQFPQSRPLDLYRRQRPMVQQQPMTVPGTR